MSLGFNDSRTAQKKGGQCRGLIVIRTHPVLVRAVQQKKNFLSIKGLITAIPR